MAESEAGREYLCTIFRCAGTMLAGSTHRASEYEEKWTAKLKWYRNNGILPEEKGGGETGTLPTSTETDGINHDQIAQLIKTIRGVE